MGAVEVFGFIGGVLSTLQAWPQVRRVRALGHGRGVSIAAWLLTFTANGVWLGYGLRIDSPSLVMTNVVSGILSVLVIAALVEERYRPLLTLPVLAMVFVVIAQTLPEVVISVLLVAMTMSRLPQVRTSWVHYRAGLPSAVSMGTVALGIAGLLCWEAYSVLSGRPFLVLTTTLALSLAVAIAVLERAGERTAIPEAVAA